MQPWWERYKPAAPARVHLLLAALTWTVVGGALLTFGVSWVVVDPIPRWPFWVGLVIAGGIVKARLVMSRAAKRIVRRIRERGDGRCVGGFFAIQTWLLVAVMILGGRLLRQNVLPSHAVGLMYTLVGVALLLGAVHLWGAWAERDAVA
jgi:hypothetical protein